ncbi:hypothetical protein BDN72DRAFT_671137 [Pluteus cervinus]|uniref:Uncharacterized protein n=1 Tax=Pluteus cervinus TaxID=181527 RepID=A0ACD3BAC8_9AGAR|nr:hypothetical protein BDN72DRAFT_671137 [Pluteus cervinus]
MASADYTSCFVRSHSSTISDKMTRESFLSEVVAWAAGFEVYNLPPLTLSLPPKSPLLKPSQPTTLRESTSTFSTARAPTLTPPRIRVDPDPRLFDVLHSSILDIDIDFTCLNGLDDQLLYAPTSSFLDLCYEESFDQADEDDSSWDEDEYRTPLSGRSTPTQRFSPESVHDNVGMWRDVGALSSDESSEDEDTDECKTCDDDEVPWYPCQDLEDAHPVGDFTQLNGGNGILVFKTPSSLSIQDNPSFILMEPSWSVPNPNQGVNFFPIPAHLSKPTATITKPNRFAALVSSLSNRLVRSNTVAAA